MKISMKKVFGLLFIAAVMSSCAVGKSPIAGLAYTDIKDGLTVTSNTGSSKVGTAKAVGYVGLVATGDASIEAASKQAGITRVQHADYQTTSILGIYTTYTTIVYGQ